MIHIIATIVSFLYRHCLALVAVVALLNDQLPSAIAVAVLAIYIVLDEILQALRESRQIGIAISYPPKDGEVTAVPGEVK